MTPIEILALVHAIKKADEKTARAQVSAGDYHVDFYAHIQGNIEVEADYQKRATVSVPWTEAYALLREVALRGIDDLIARVVRGETITQTDLESIKTAGFLSENIMVETMKQAFDAKKAPKGQGSIMARVEEVEAAVERVKEIIAGGLGKTRSDGRVLTDLDVTQVAPPPAGFASPVQIAQKITAPNVQAQSTP